MEEESDAENDKERGENCSQAGANGSWGLPHLMPTKTLILAAKTPGQLLCNSYQAQQTGLRESTFSSLLPHFE